MYKKTIISAFILLIIMGNAFGYDLNTKELVPVKFQRATAHAPVKPVEKCGAEQNR